MPTAPPHLHVAVWEGDVDGVRHVLNSLCPEGDETKDPIKAEKLQQVLEVKDIRGNSALHLAVRVVQPTQRAIVKLLLDRNANVTSRNADGWTCAHDAALCDDEFLLAQVYLQGEKQLMDSVESSQETFMQALEKLPDFEAEIFIEAQSWVPMVSSVLPSDTIRIWKRGSQLRIDSTLKGLDGVKWKKGHLSNVLLGREGWERAGHAVVLDHEGRKFFDVLKAMHNSSVGNMDLALQVLLTTPMSSSNFNATKLEFVKQKQVKAEGKRDQSRVSHDEEQKVRRSRQRKCPWPGTTYKMQNFSIEAQFRPVVNPDRKLNQVASPFEEVKQFVEHLQSSVNSGKYTNKDKRSTRGILKDDNSLLTLRLEKRRKVQMHLDVIAGDTIQWEFLSKSSDFCFMATHFHDDQEQLVCRTDGVKNVEIIGAFQVEHNGSFVLMWQNTQKGFTIDRSGIKITYKIAHIRPPVKDEVVNTSTTADLSPEDELTCSSSSQDNTATKNSSPGRLTDEQKCEIFRQVEYLPNPTTITTAFADYFKLGNVSNEEKNCLNHKHYGLKNKPTITKLFGNKQQDHVQELSTTLSPNRAETATSGMKNTVRSLTLLPAPRRVRKDFEAKVVMTEKFPFQLRDFLPVIKFISTTGDHLNNLDEFFQMKLPPGFPVKFELPMMFTIRVAYTFQKIVLNPQLDPKMFEIPNEYQEVFTLDEVRS
ncbi:hypothetical protein PsorP6_005106 [Peronosclerospora sorghi]|uniref:Uncharacterized protein n=1 Tax=Peronosclerospora sorghi TaxID=230839 RepID=A0ACC0W2A2_9STRA|nr:hypothetical protein PsorP6_005106 [Peronosclerospora sorghi]